VRPRTVASAAVRGVAVVAALMLSAGGCWPADPPTSDAVVAPTGSREHLRLAREGSLHFVLEPEARTLTLFHGSARLRRWDVETVRAGPRRLVAGRDIERLWHATAWSAPRLDPPVRRERRVIESDSVVPPDPSGTDAWIPPTPEEAVPSPPRFVVHFEGGLGLEVVSVGERVPSRGLLRTVVGALGAPLLGRDRFRVRVTMDVAEAGALYRAFPPDAALVIILPPTAPNETPR